MLYKFTSILLRLPTEFVVSLYIDVLVHVVGPVALVNCRLDASARVARLVILQKLCSVITPMLANRDINNMHG